ncbi:uncharacterized protein LOC131891316 [Tigriopus californicus]|uniref:uncharacterized protein LOC131891316 n=1 Tax=Tigriopus californicus TaxID=6832 RepID=UPI0027DA9043|nr:uncharacterized protein LOC131891316 [Tigriopus californicus]
MTSLGRSQNQQLADLRKVLKGEARSFIDQLPHDGRSLETAIEILKNIYDRPELHVQEILKTLFDMPRTTSEVSSLKAFLASSRGCLQRLSALDISGEQLANILFLSLCERTFSTDIQKAWIGEKRTTSKSKKSRAATPADLFEFIEDKLAQSLQLSSTDKSTLKKDFSLPASFSSTCEWGLCNFCGQKHKSHACPKLKSMSREEIIKTIKDQRLCSLCYEPGHSSSSCWRSSCPINNCGGLHTVYVHRDASWKSNLTSPNNSVRKSSTPFHVNNISPPPAQQPTNTFKPKTMAICKSVMTFLITPSGERLLVRVILDSWSEIPLIRRSVANFAGLDGSPTSLTMMTSGKQITQFDHQREVSFSLENLDGSYRTPSITACTVPEITVPIRKINFNPCSYDHLKGIQFTEPFPSEGNLVPDIMIGEPLYSHLLVGSPIMGRLNEPGAQQTLLGFALVGSLPSDECKTIHTSAFTCCKTKIPESCSDALAIFWSIESLGLPSEASESEFTLEQQEALTMMENISSYDHVTKKWTTGLLWKISFDNSSNIYRARKVMDSVQNKTASQGILDQVHKSYQAFLDNNFAEIPKNQFLPSGSPHYYLETHPVFQPGKIRVVHNAASKDYVTGLSLNDHLYSGPNLIPARPWSSSSTI